VVDVGEHSQEVRLGNHADTAARLLYLMQSQAV